MNVSLKIFFLTTLILLSACATSKVTLFPAGQEKVPPSNINSVGIYRTVPPPETFTELGLISFKSSSMDLVDIYEHLRTDAALQGADAVVGIKTISETHTETTPVQQCLPSTVCDASGICSTHDECHTEFENKNVTTYLTQGSLIRRKL